MWSSITGEKSEIQRQDYHSQSQRAMKTIEGRRLRCSDINPPSILTGILGGLGKWRGILLCGGKLIPRSNRFGEIPRGFEEIRGEFHGGRKVVDSLLGPALFVFGHPSGIQGFRIIGFNGDRPIKA